MPRKSKGNAGAARPVPNASPLSPLDIVSPFLLLFRMLKATLKSYVDTAHEFAALRLGVRSCIDCQWTSVPDIVLTVLTSSFVAPFTITNLDAIKFGLHAMPQMSDMLTENGFESARFARDISYLCHSFDTVECSRQFGPGYYRFVYLSLANNNVFVVINNDPFIVFGDLWKVDFDVKTPNDVLVMHMRHERLINLFMGKLLKGRLTAEEGIALENILDLYGFNLDTITARSQAFGRFEMKREIEYLKEQISILINDLVVFVTGSNPRALMQHEITGSMNEDQKKLVLDASYLRQKMRVYNKNIDNTLKIPLNNRDVDRILRDFASNCNAADLPGPDVKRIQVNDRLTLERTYTRR